MVERPHFPHELVRNAAVMARKSSDMWNNGTGAACQITQVKHYLLHYVPLYFFNINYYVF
jgi:hypothetical protein